VGHPLPADLPSLTRIAAAIRAGETSPVEVTRACLDRIERHDPTLNCFITVTAEAALEQARAAEAEIRRGEDRGPLHGMPVALKDLIDTAGVATTAASALFEDRVPTEDAEVVRRLRSAGAVILGKLNLHEFAYGGSGVISRYGPSRNPFHPGHITGGSSSGSAAAVAAGLCHAALGSDTSGSIRLPASLCGVVGFKPSYGAVSVRGVIPLAPSYDHVGPIARTVADAAAVFAAIRGYDPTDIYSSVATVPPADDDTAAPLRVGVARATFTSDLDPEVAAAFEAALSVLAGLPATLRDVALPIDDDRTVFLAEAYAYHRLWLESAPERYQPETLRRLRSGASVSAADYIARWQDLQRIRRGTRARFADLDVIVTPTVPIPPPSFAELEAHPERLRPHELLLLRNTRPFDILGTPTLSVPCGLTRAGLPIGLQIAGPPGADARVLRIGQAFEARQAPLAPLAHLAT
jgi:aspartyl-tRNA(Asn)/glutamyl-tRNA(Gln) amidotransferase subunit A